MQILSKGRRTHSPFWVYSSYNKRGGKMLPIVVRRMNQCMDMWAGWSTQAEIAEALDISVDAVKEYIRRGKRRGDPRATRPLNRRGLRARVRKMQIAQLFAAGMSTSEIAKQLDCNPRLVQLRLKELNALNKQRENINEAAAQPRAA